MCPYPLIHQVPIRQLGNRRYYPTIRDDHLSLDRPFRDNESLTILYQPTNQQTDRQGAHHEISRDHEMTMSGYYLRIAIRLSLAMILYLLLMHEGHLQRFWPKPIIVTFINIDIQAKSEAVGHTTIMRSLASSTAA
jgi:hypothetical protein